MLMSGTLHGLVLAGTCLCVYGTPVHLRGFTPTPDGACDQQCASSATTVESEPSDVDHVTGLIVDVGAGGGAGPHGGPEGIDPVKNGGSLGGGSGPSEAGEEVWRPRSGVKMGDAQRQSEVVSMPSVDPDVKKPVLSPSGGGELLNPDGFVASSTASPQARETQDQAKEARTSPPSSAEPPNPEAPIQKVTSMHTSIPPTGVASSRTSTRLSVWGHDGTLASLPDPLLPEISPNLMPREDGPESLWTEAARPGGVDTAVPPSQDEATEGTMSSEALPLIFEPFEDVASEAAAAVAAVTLVPGSAQPPAAMATRVMPGVDLDQLVTVETDGDGPSRAPPQLTPDWTPPPWQTSGGELLEPISSSGPSVSQQQDGREPEDRSERGPARTPNLEENLQPSSGPSFLSFQHAVTMVTMATHHPAHRTRPETEEVESDEEQDEDEDEENSEESVEDDSEEDLTETPKTPSTQPPYSLIPPPPVWVQRNQGLMRSWVELIREKAGYVSGMLAPVGIGITGALLIVGALYSIRMIHRKRRNSFKHQRRKVRQPEQPREPGTSRQDQAMLLADSSEDEF